MVTALFKSFIKEPPHTNFAGEDPGEKVLYVLRKSFITNLSWLLLSALLIIAPSFFNSLLLSLSLDYKDFISPQFSFNINAMWYLFTFGFIFQRFLNWYFNVYIITNMRIIDMDFFSLFDRKVSDAPLRNIEDISYDVQGAFESLFNIGDVIIQTAAEKPNFEFESITNPSNVQDILSDLVKGVRHGA